MLHDITLKTPPPPPTMLFFVNSELGLLSSWFDQNHLALLPLGSSLYNYDIVLNGIYVGTQENKKILRFTLDKMLAFNDHISRKAYANL